MRILCRLPHPILQITVFSNDGRFPVQFELSGQTQIYRFRQDERLKSLDDVRRLIDPVFVEGVLRQFSTMQELQSKLIDRHRPAEDAFSDLPDII